MNGVSPRWWIGAHHLERAVMKNSKQATLFRSWGGKKPLRDGNARPSSKGKAPARSQPQNQPRHVASSHEPGPDSSPRAAAFVDLTESEGFGFKDEEELDRFLLDGLVDEASRDEGGNFPSCSGPSKFSAVEEAPGFDPEAGERWVYPTNYPVRDYQFNIVQKCLFRNTLVCLPTGLGKTFIAAVVMFNFYRWYPNGKVVFLAPTKPLVTQQIEACHNIMGIPQSHLAEMTGGWIHVCEILPLSLSLCRKHASKGESCAVAVKESVLSHTSSDAE